MLWSFASDTTAVGSSAESAVISRAVAFASSFTPFATSSLAPSATSCATASSLALGATASSLALGAAASCVASCGGGYARVRARKVRLNGWSCGRGRIRHSSTDIDLVRLCTLTVRGIGYAYPRGRPFRPVRTLRGWLRRLGTRHLNFFEKRSRRAELRKTTRQSSNE